MTRADFDTLMLIAIAVGVWVAVLFGLDLTA